MIGRDYTFQLTDKEYNRLEKWHKKVTKGENYFGAIGGELTFEIIPTSIGDGVVVKYQDEELYLRKIGD